VLKAFFSFYLRLFHLLRIRGVQHIPAHGPVILCANHSSYFDSMLLALCCRRQVRFLIHHSFYHHPVFGWFAQRSGAIPVTQNGNDKEAMSRALAVLRQGGVLGIFPEGRLTLSGLPNAGKSGAALLATATGAVIVPVTIAGAFGVYPKGRKKPGAGTITVTVHPPVRLDIRRRKEKDYLQQATDALMERIGRRLTAYGRRRNRQRKKYGKIVAKEI
jgi:1-acyl-sn-glycerol-3-phosphate acyltransferase